MNRVIIYFICLNCYLLDMVMGYIEKIVEMNLSNFVY